MNLLLVRVIGPNHARHFDFGGVFKRNMNLKQIMSFEKDQLPGKGRLKLHSFVGIMCASWRILELLVLVHPTLFEVAFSIASEIW